jgi:hypothetical protein
MTNYYAVAVDELHHVVSEKESKVKTTGTLRIAAVETDHASIL